LLPGRVCRGACSAHQQSLARVRAIAGCAAQQGYPVFDSRVLTS